MDWTGLLDITSRLTFSLLVFASGVVMLGFLVESERRRTTSSQLEEMTHTFERARATFAEAHDGTSARQIPGSVVGITLDQILESSDMWLFRGGSARYQRAAALPCLAEIKAAAVGYQIQILDPRDPGLCAAYADYRRTARPTGQQLPIEDASSIRNEILATLYAAGWYQCHSRVRPRAFLANVYSPMRIDIGTNGAVFTVASHTQPALLAPSGFFLYEAIRDEFEQAGSVLPRVQIPNGLDLFPPERDAVTAEMVEAALNQMTVSTADGKTSSPLLSDVRDVDFEAVAERVFTASPY